MKRDISERYYSQEIKRLIGEYYFGPKIATPTWRPATRLRSPSFQQPTGNRLKNVANALFMYLCTCTVMKAMFFCFM